MTLRPVRTAFLATALYAVVLVSTASAEQHTVRVTLVDGQVLTYTVDVASGATATAAQLPPVPSPVKTIEDLGPIPTTTPVPVPTVPQLPVPTATVPSVPNPTGSPIPGTGGGGTVPSNPVTGGGDNGGGQTTDPTAPVKGIKDKAGANTEAAQGKVREGARKARDRAKEVVAPGRHADGTPTIDNPTFSLSTPGAAPK